MEKLLKYSVLRYSPSTVAGEKINLGILFYEEEINFRQFMYSKKFSRLSSFDDEIDIRLVKTLLQSISEEVEGNLFTYNKFDIEHYTKYYVNDFSFDKPKAIVYDNLDEMLERLYKTYFRFEFDKAERPTKEDDKKLLEQVISSKGTKILKDKYVMGQFQDKIRYDIITDDYDIKIFDFDGKNLNILINNAKTWAWNCLHSKKKSIIIYRYNDVETKYHDEFNIIMNIFEESNAEIYSFEEGVQMLQALS